MERLYNIVRSVSDQVKAIFGWINKNRNCCRGVLHASSTECTVCIVCLYIGETTLLQHTVVVVAGGNEIKLAKL